MPRSLWTARPTLDYRSGPAETPAFDRRDQVAAALAAFLRGDIDSIRFREMITTVNTEDRCLREICFLLYFIYDDVKSHPISVSPEGWEELRRTIAFLKSDIAEVAELPPAARLQSQRESRVRGWTALLSIVTAIVLARWQSPWWSLLPGALTGPLAFAPISRRKDHSRDTRPFFPFKTEYDWLAHQHFVTAENLPQYDPVLHQQPIRSTWCHRVMRVPALVPLVLLVFLLIPVIWALNFVLGKSDDSKGRRVQRGTRSD